MFFLYAIEIVSLPKDNILNLFSAFMFKKKKVYIFSL